jgi:hypothetical protein
VSTASFQVTQAGRVAQRAPRYPQAAAHTLVSVAAALLALLSSPVHAQSYPLYTVTALPLSSVTAFNDSGLILGRGFVPCTGICTQSDVAVLYDTRTGTLSSLGGGFGGGAQFGAINAKGQLAGSLTTVNGSGATVRSVVLRQVDGTLTTLAAPTLASTQNSGLQARGLNAAGQIALAHSDGLDAFGPLCGNYQGWIGTGASAASWQAVGPAGTVLRLVGINASGVGVGATVPSASCGGLGGGFKAVAAQASGALVDLHGSLPGSFSRANGINDLGYAVGDFDTGARTLPDTYNPQGVPITHAVVWNTAAQAWFDLGPAGRLSRFNAVNNRGEVVGSVNGQVAAGQAYTATESRAVLGNLATNWPLVDLNTLLTNNTAGWVVQDAVAINTSGQIVVRATSTSGSGYALLTPTTAPVDPYATLPSAPASLAASQVTGTSAVLTWTHTARNATRLVVERCKGILCSSYVAVATLPSDTTRFSDATLARRTTYRWRVRAGNAKGVSVASNVVTATTLR